MDLEMSQTFVIFVSIDLTNVLMTEKKPRTILFTSDTHLPSTDPNFFLEWISTKWKEDKPEAIIHVGDFTEHTGLTLRVLEEINSLGIRFGFVCGNHDLWGMKRRNPLSDEIFNIIFPEYRNGKKHPNIFYLENAPLIIDDIAIIGTVGWYDYTAKHEQFSEILNEEYDQLKQSFYWSDSDYIDFIRDRRKTDISFCKELYDSVKKQLDMLSADEKIKHIIVCSHVPIFKEIYDPKSHMPTDLRGMFLNAFYGNFTLGELVKQYPKVCDVVCGHIHKEMHSKIGNINAQVVGADYGELCMTFTMIK